MAPGAEDEGDARALFRPNSLAVALRAGGGADLLARPQSGVHAIDAQLTRVRVRHAGGSIAIACPCAAWTAELDCGHARALLREFVKAPDRFALVAPEPPAPVVSAASAPSPSKKRGRPASAEEAAEEVDGDDNDGEAFLTTVAATVAARARRRSQSDPRSCGAPSRKTATGRPAAAAGAPAAQARSLRRRRPRVP